MNESPLTAPTVVELLRRQIAVTYPLARYAAVAKEIGYPISSFAAWLADEDSIGFRRVQLNTAHDLLRKLKAPAKVHARMEALWIAEHKAVSARRGVA